MINMLKDLPDVLERKAMLERFLIFLAKIKVIKLWRDFYQFYAIMKNIKSPKCSNHSRTEKTMGQSQNIFSGQGVENFNEDI
jgi:hypothetical protein